MKNRMFFLILLLQMVCLDVYCQNYNMSNGTPISTCSGNFYDNGGPGANHADAGSFSQRFTSSDGNRLKFVFTSFNTAGSSDILRVYDGPDNTYPLIASRSGGAGGFTVESTGSELTFEFSTFTNGLTAAGWAATISCTTPALSSYTMNSGTVTACSGVFYDNGGATANYPDNEDRVMSFCSGSSDFLQFTFKQATIASGDSLFVYDGNSTAANPIAVFTSGSRFETFTSTGACVTFLFKSTASGNGTGWQAIFQCINTAQAPTNYSISNSIIYTCGGKFYDDGGTANHGDGGSYLQTFYSANGNRIRFDFTSFNTAGGSDLIQVFDGPSTSHPLIMSRSGNSGPFIVESTGSSLTFTFGMFTNGLTAPGWVADITCTTPTLFPYSMSSGTVTACAGAFYDNGGASANYANNEDRVMTFCSGTTDFLQFTFKQAGIAASDSLFVYDGNTTAANPIAVFTAGSRFETFTSSSTCITFRFKSNASGTGSGWLANFQCVNTAQAPTNYSISNSIIYTCGGKFYDDGGTGNHGDAGTYLQTFYSANGNRLKFDFTSFVTAGTSDIVQVFDGPNSTYPLIASRSGNAGAFVVESTGSSLTFSFSMFNNGLTSAGWVADISCTTPVLTEYHLSSGTINTCSGVFYDQGGPLMNYAGNEDRVQTFCSDNGQYIIFDFLHQFNISTDDTLFVYDGNSTTSPLIGVYSGDIFPERIYSKSGSCVTFRFKSNAVNTSTGWRAFISCSGTIPTQNFLMQNGIRYTCGGTFLDNGGASGNYSDNFNRTMTFVSDAGSGCGIKVLFSTFNTQTGSDILTIYDGASDASPVLGSFSGSSLPGGTAGIQSTGNSITFKFVSNGGTNAAGWIAAMSCPNQPGTPAITTNSPVCAPATLTLNTNTVVNGTYLWTGPNGFTSTDEDPTIANATPVASGSYKLILTKDGCVSESTVNVLVKPVTPAPTAGSNSPVCENSPLALTASSIANASYTWTGPDGFTSNNQNPSIAVVTMPKAGDYTLTATVDGCTSGASITNVVVSTVGSVTATNNGPVCEGSNAQLSANTISGATYIWSGPNGFSSADQNPFIAGISSTASGLYTVTATLGSCSKQSSTSLSVTTNPVTPVGLTITGAGSVCSGQTGITYSIPAVAGATGYDWTLPAGAVITAGINTRSITLDIASTDGDLQVTPFNSCGNGASVIKTIRFADPVGDAGIISGVSIVCQGTTGISYSITPVSNATGYNWTVPPGSNITSGASTNTILVTAGSTAGNITVTPTGLCNNGASSSASITVNPLPTAVITSPTNTICPGTNVPITATVVPLATYEWFKDNVSTGAPGTANSLLVDAGGNYKVVVNNGCSATSNSINIQLTSLPGDAGNISGSTAFCPGEETVSYSINSVTGATDYLWEILPTNAATIFSGQGTSSILVDFQNQNATVKVTPRNSCGTGNSSTLSTNVDNSFSCTSGINFSAYPTNPCLSKTVKFTNYSTNQPLGTTMKWTFGAGASPATANGNGPHNVTYSSIGDKSVTVEYIDNFSGFSINSVTKENYIFVANSGACALPASQTISGNTSAGSGQLLTYSVGPAAVGSSYRWSFPAGFTIVSSNSDSSYVTVMSGSTGGDITLTETNATGSTTNTIQITIDGVTSFFDVNADKISCDIRPNPFEEYVSVRVNASFNSDLKIKVINTSGSVVFAAGEFVTNQEINIGSELRPGIYFLEISYQNKVQTIKLIKM